MVAGVERLGPRLWRATAKDGARYVVRPLVPSDAPAMRRAWRTVSPEDRMMRALRALPELPERLARQLCSVDPERDVALVFTPEDRADELVGGARLMRDRAGDGAEYAVSVVSDRHGQGLGRMALALALEVGREIGLREAWGMVSRGNAPMRGLARSLGFTEHPDPDDPTIIVTRRAL